MVEKTEIFACGLIDKVIVMSDFTRNNWLTDQRFNLEPASPELVEGVESVFDDLIADDDLLMEQILDNMNSTSLGQVLKKIAVMPEVRKQKVLKVRQQLTEGRYNLTERLDLALEKVLDDLKT
jgi:hypothetical protein